MTKNLDLQKLIKICTLAILGFCLFKFVGSHIKGLDVLSLMGLLFTAGGLALTWLQEKKDEQKEILSHIWEVDEKGDDRDRIHDQEIAAIRRDVVAISIKFENHCAGYGHSETTKEIIELNKSVQEIKAQLVMATRVSEIHLRMDAIEESVEVLNNKREDY